MKCCCGKYQTTESCRINDTVHEPLGSAGNFCGSVKDHTIRDLETHLAKSTAEVERLKEDLKRAISPWSVRLASPLPNEPFNQEDCSIIDIGHSARVIIVECPATLQAARRDGMEFAARAVERLAEESITSFSYPKMVAEFIRKAAEEVKP